MKNITIQKRFPIIAGITFTYPGTKNHKLTKIGYYIKEFYYTIYPDGDQVLIGEKQIKRIIF